MTRSRRNGTFTALRKAASDIGYFLFFFFFCIHSAFDESLSRAVFSEEIQSACQYPVRFDDSQGGAAGAAGAGSVAEVVSLRAQLEQRTAESARLTAKVDELGSSLFELKARMQHAVAEVRQQQVGQRDGRRRAGWANGVEACMLLQLVSQGVARWCLLNWTV